MPTRAPSQAPVRAPTVMKPSLVIFMPPPETAGITGLGLEHLAPPSEGDTTTPATLPNVTRFSTGA